MAALNQVRVTIQQVQKGEPYHGELEVAVDSPDGSQLHQVVVESEKTECTLAAKGKPTAVRLDPEHRLLLWTSEYGDRPAALLREP